MNDDEVDKMRDSLNSHISEAMNPDGGIIVTRWILAVERFSADGKGVAFFASPDMQPWEVIGMSEMASEVARLQVTSEIVDEMYSLEDDEED